MRAASRAGSSPATIRAASATTFKTVNTFCSDGPFADAPHIHSGEHGDDDAGHDLCRIQLEPQQALRQMGLGRRGQELPSGMRSQNDILSQTRHQRPKVLGEGDRHGGIEARLDHEKLRPAEEEPQKLPKASRRKTYCPPACGYMAASSAEEIAPSIVNSPPKTHRAINSPGVGPTGP